MADDLTPDGEGGPGSAQGQWPPGPPPARPVLPPPPPPPLPPPPGQYPPGQFSQGQPAPWPPGPPSAPPTGQYGQGQYAPPRPGWPAPAAGPDPLAIAALVLGIVALPLSLFLVFGIAAVVCGAIALSRSGRTGRSGKGMAIAGLVLGAVSLVLGALLVVVILLGGSSDDELAITEAGAGDCIDYASQSSDSVETYTPRDCDSAHGFEVVGVVTATGDAYPGEDALNALAETRCRALFAGYVGVELDESEFDLQPLMPTPTAWDGGDHEIACVVLAPDGSELTESVRGSRR